MKQLVIKGGRIFYRGKFRSLEVLVEGGRIVAVEKRVKASSAKVCDASGCLVLPGGVDAHVHFALPLSGGLRTADDFFTGGGAAAAGGITTVIDYTTPRPGEGPLSAFRQRLQLARKAAAVDFGLHQVLIDWRPEWEGELRLAQKAGAPSLKVFMIYAERGWQMVDGKMLELMEVCRRLGLVLCVHAENDAIIEHLTSKELSHPRGAISLARSRPLLAELEAVSRVILFARHSGCRLHLVHLSTTEAASLVGQARKEGLSVSGETCPQYLLLDEKKLRTDLGHLYACCPPLRTNKEQEGLWQALKSGWLQAITTDHCAFSKDQKDSWGSDFTRIPYGLPGVETSLAATFTFGVVARRISQERWAQLHTEGPARLFGLYPQKGVIAPGADADLVIWDPEKRWRVEEKRLQSKLGWNPYRGFSFQGRARQVFLRGRPIAEEGRFLAGEPLGRFIRR